MGEPTRLAEEEDERETYKQLEVEEAGEPGGEGEGEVCCWCLMACGLDVE